MERKRKWKYAENSVLQNGTLENLPRQILKNRGITDEKEIEKFFYGNLNDLYDTRRLKDAEKGVDIIIDAIEKKENIVIYGDYDCDGAMASAVAVSALRNIGATANYYTNDRFSQGYGLVVSGVDEILAKFPDTKLIVTVDNGIMAHEGIDYAKSLGLRVVVTDHHEQGETLPNADAVIDPKRADEDYPCPYLCGAGVIWKIMLLLYYKMGKELSYLYDKLDVVAMATVGDIVPLLDENRIIVKEGLKRIKEEKNPVFRILREVTEVTDVTADFTLAFVYVPMVNSIGRLTGDIDKAIDMFLTEDEEKIREIISFLKATNDKRKEMTAEQEEIGEKILEEEGLSEIIVISSERFHEGLVGLVAGRLKEKYNRPSIVLQVENGIAKGSVRGIKGMHMKNSLDLCKDLLLTHGGHELACGLSLKEENLEKFKEKISEIAKETLKEEHLIKTYNVDLIIKEQDLKIELVDLLDSMQPFGNSFEKPVLMLQEFNVIKASVMGAEKNHLRLSGTNGLTMIAWREALTYYERGGPLKVRALGYPNLNVFNGNTSVQFMIDGDNFIGI